MGRPFIPVLGILVALFVGARGLLAQAPSTISGRVLDAETGAPLADAEVALGDLMLNSSADGRFTFGSVSAGRSVLVARRVGYAALTQVITVLPGLGQEVELRLKPVSIGLDTIAVNVSRSNPLQINREDLVRRGRNLAQALDGWQGITVRRGAAGDAVPQVRGSAPDEVLVLVDGFPVNDPYTGRADLSRISTLAVEHVTLAPGVQTAREGNRALGGVITVETRQHIAPEISGAISTRGAASVRAGTSAGPVTVALAHDWLADNFSYDIPAVRGSGEGTRRNAGGSVWGLNARARLGVDIILRASASDRGLPGPVTNATTTARGEDRSLLIGMRYRGPLEASASFEALSTRFHDAQPLTGSPYDSRTRGVGVTAGIGAVRRLSLSGLSGDVGLRMEGRHDHFSGDGVADGAEFSRGSIRLDARLHPRRMPSLTFAPVLRVDLWSGLDGAVTSGRLDVAWQRGRTGITLSAGSGASAPVLADLFFREGNGVRVNPDLRPERIVWELEAGIRQEASVLGAPIDLSVRGFVGRVDDMVLWGVSPGSAFVWTPSNVDVRRRGGEVSLGATPMRGLRIEGTSTMSFVTTTAPGHHQVLYRPRVTEAADLLWQAGRWNADLRWHWIGTRYRDSRGINALDPISLWDAGLERHLGERVSLRADVRDLTDARAEFIAGFPAPGRTFSLTLSLGIP